MWRRILLRNLLPAFKFDKKKEELVSVAPIYRVRQTDIAGFFLFNITYAVANTCIVQFCIRIIFWHIAQLYVSL